MIGTNNFTGTCKLATLLIFFLLVLSPFISKANVTTPIGLPPIQQYPDEVLVEIGRRIFFDTRFSVDGRVSCASCHQIDRFFQNGETTSTGAVNQTGTRNVPSLLNVAYLNALFWDGRSPNLELQARSPLLNPVEHGLAAEADVLKILRTDPYYASQLSNVFKISVNELTIAHVSRVIANYERTFLSGNSYFDRYLYFGDKNAMPSSAIRGFNLFTGRAGCASCHTVGDTHALFTDQQFEPSPIRLPDSVAENLGKLTERVIDAKSRTETNTLDNLIATDKEIASLGRFVTTLNPADIGKFKVPSLRNVAMTAPYMHDGSVDTLAEAIELELYGRDGYIKYPIILTTEEREDLLDFLKALTGPESK